MTNIIARDLIFGIPGMIFVWIIIGIAITLLLTRTRFGKHLFAIGVNRQTARLSGVNVNAMVVLTYVLAGAMAAFSGFLLVGYTQTLGINTFSHQLSQLPSGAHRCRVERGLISAQLLVQL